MGGKAWSVCALFVISVLWKPVLTDHCSLACKGTPSGATFLNGHKYNYGVEGTVSIFLTTVDKQETSVKLLGQVSVTALGNCVHELHVQNLVISGPDGRKYNSPEGVDKPVRFTLEDGRLGPELCAEESDTRRSLNVKRAIISLLQTENKPSTQVDIFGACPTQASSSQEGNSELVHRIRDLSHCAHREQSKNALVTAIYNPTAEIKSTQILQSTLNVESKVISGVPEKVSATEDYLYKPFAVGENGAKAQVHTKLTLTGKSAGAASSSKCTESRTVIFENPHSSKASGNANTALQIIKEISGVLAHEAGSKSAGIFAQLIRALRNLNKENLLSIYNQVEKNELQRRVFLDALLRTGTGYSVEVIVDLLKRDKLNQFEKPLALISLGNAKHVNSDAVKAAAALLDQGSTPKEAYLGIGALAGTYCREHNCHGSKVDGVVALSQKFAAKINCRTKTKVEEDAVVYVLKGVRNIRHLEDNLIDKVVRCANDNQAKARIRVAAIEAFSADPCSAKLKKTALDILKNRQLDSEIRIKAYLAVVECPCAGSASEIKNLLDSEPVHQVGRYITSHLRHLRSTTNPDRFHARHHYSQIRTPSKFNIDNRKYSYYCENSFNVDALGVGGTAEQSVIYSQDSFLPRSVSLNLTAEVFGHSVNVLEVGGRQGNLDRVIEHFVGPKGILRNQKPQDVYDNLVKKFQETSQKVESNLSRGRRSVKSEIDNFDKHLKAEQPGYNNELDLDLYLNVFGTDAIFLSLGDDKGFNYDAVLDKFLKIVHGGLNEIKHMQHDIRAHVLFLDAELAYPTSTGLPLKLDLVGSATGRLDISTNVDLVQAYKNPRNAKFDVKLVPSTDVEVAGSFFVDSDAVSTGVRVVANLHSSTGAHVIAKIIEDGNGIDIQVGLPIEQQELVVASNDVFYVTAIKGEKEKAVPVKLDAEKKKHTACFDQIDGLITCVNVLVPFTVSGPDAQVTISNFIARLPFVSASASVIAKKNDLRGYHLKGVFRNDYPRRQSFELLVEVEGSKSRRNSFTGEWVYTDEEKSIKLDLDTRLKHVGGSIAYYNKPNGLLLEVKAKNDQEDYNGKVGFEIKGGGNRRVYKPVLEYKIPNQDKQSVQIDGQLIEESSQQGKKYTLQGLKVHIPQSQEVVDISGLLLVGNSFEIDLKARKGEHNGLLTVILGERVKVDFQNTLNPYINFILNGRFDVTGPASNNVRHNEFDLVYGQDLSSTKNKVIFSQLLKYDNKKNEISIITKNKFEILALPFKVRADGEIDPKKINLELEGVYVDRNAKFDLDARTQIKKQGDYSVKVYGEVDKKGLELFAKRDIVSPEKSNLENYIHIKNQAKYELSGVVLHKTKPNDVNVGAVGHLKITGSSNEDIKFDVGVVENANLYSSHAKVSCSKGDLVDYLLKVNKGANPSGQLKFNLKDTISANGEFKQADGKGNGLVLVDFKKAQRKIKADIKYEVKDPSYNADASVYLNYEKDNNDVVRFSTNSKKTDTLLDSKNKLDYAGKKLELNLHHEGTTGKHSCNVEVVLPDERCLSAKVEQDYTVKNDVVNGHSTYTLSDAEKRGGKASTLSFKTKIANTNVEKDIYNVEGEIGLQLKDGRDLRNTFYLKNVPEGEKFKFDFKTDLKGSLVPKPASLAASGEAVDSLTIANDKYRVKGNYGDDIGFELAGTVNAKLLDKEDKKYQEESTLTIRLPFEKAHDIKWTSSVLYLQPETSDVVVEYTLIEAVQINGDLYKVDTTGKLGLTEGSTKLKVLVPHSEPFVLGIDYKGDGKGENKHGRVDIKSQYGKGKTASVSVAGESSAQSFKLAIGAQAPQAEKLRNIDIKVTGKAATADSFSGSVELRADDKQYDLDFATVNSKANPSLSLKFKCPTGNPVIVELKGTGLSSNQGKINVKLQNVKDVNLEAEAEGVIQKDNVDLKMQANSEKLGLKNYKVSISSKDAGSGKRLEFHAVNDGKNVLSGSTSFISKQEGTKTIIEGSGSVKVKEEQKSANFKSIRTVLTEGNEQGVENFLDLTIGERSYVAESRFTNLEYKSSYVYCEEKKQCANIEVQSKLNTPSQGVYQHLVSVSFDLRKLGVTPEFGLLITNEISEKKLPQYNLDLHLNKADKKYHLKVYSQPELGKLPAGIIVTLPTRVLALESVVSFPKDMALPFPIRGEVALHLDKNKPSLKTAAWFNVDVTGGKQGHTAIAEVGFSHPKFRGKNAVIKYRGNIQLPTENSIKIESLAHLSLPTGDSCENKFYFEVNPTHIKLLLTTPVLKLIDLEGSASIKDNNQEASLKVSVLQGKPVFVKGVVKGYQYVELTTGYTEQSDRKLSVVAELQPEKRVSVSADIVLPNEKKNIAHGAIFLQDNLVKTEYGISKDNIKYSVNDFQKGLQTFQNRVKDLAEKTYNDQKAKAEKIVALSKQVDESLREELQKLAQEVTNDQQLKEIAQYLHEITTFLAKLIDDVVHATKPLIDQIEKTLQNFYKSVEELYVKKLEPQLKQLYANFADLVSEGFDGLLDLVAHFSALVNDFYEKHRPELEELTNTLTEIFKDITRLVVAQLKEFRERFGQILSDLVQQIKEMPIINVIKEKWDELEVPQQALSILRETHNTLRGILPTEELSALADAIFNYVEIKLKQQKVDDAAQIRGIYEKLLAAIGSVSQLLKTHLNQLGIPSLVTLNAAQFASNPASASVSGLGGVPAFSVLNELVKGDLPNPLDVLKAYRPRSLNPLDEIPAKLRAVIVNGQHIFTFDGRHLTFPGSCRYILAHDFVDRNFTLAVQLQNGQPKAVVLEDKSGSVLELKDNGQVALNGAVHGFPVVEKDSFAYKDQFGRVNIGSEYGVHVKCRTNLEVCYVEVSGFYLGKLRGLLGDGNNEPYDDFRLPNGKVSTSESEFGNSYRLASSCAQVKTPEHSHHQLHAALPPACEKVFGSGSPLWPLALVLDVAPFRQACIHAATGDDAHALKQACDLGAGYAALAYTGLLPAVVPPVCLQCTDADSPKNIGDTYQVKLPNKKADVVVVVELTKPTEKNYKDLVVPLVSQLVDQLKSRHIPDIKVFLVGVTPEYPYPAIYDTDLKLKNAKVDFRAESRYDELPNLRTGNEKVDEGIAKLREVAAAIKVKLGINNLAAGYTSILQLPLRPGAVKQAIYVVGEKCNDTILPISILRQVYFNLATPFSFHAVVTTTDGIKVTGKNPAQIVGYTEDSVLVLGDKKLKESDEVRKTLEVEDDQCRNLIERNDGLVLSSSNYFALNGGQQKQFLQTAAAAILNKLVSTSVEQECVCTYSDPFTARTACVKTKEVAARASGRRK